MTLLAEPQVSPLAQVYVAVDLETSGLDPRADEVIEVGAVRFQGPRVLDTFSSMVNPYRALSPFIQRLTGISQDEVDAAPPFGAVAPQLQAFIGDAPIVGQNVAFDLAFLAHRGLRFTAPVFDTRDLGGMLLPTGEHSLAALAAALEVPQPLAHRALADAQTTHRVLAALLERALTLDPAILAELHRLATVARWPLRHLLRGLEAEAARRAGAGPSHLGPGGLDLEALHKRLQARDGGGRRPPVLPSLTQESVAALVMPGGPLAATLPGYEIRPEQEAMLRAVFAAFQEPHHLVVEAGTGVGKSLAYLLPAALHALEKNLPSIPTQSGLKAGPSASPGQRRVVVSTNTINLQEQLVQKDLPAVEKVLERAGLAPSTSSGQAPSAGSGLAPVRKLRFTSLKGRANYLCLRRWARLRSSDSLSVDEARLLGMLLVWLQETSTGDRAELRLSPQEGAIWERLSAQGSAECPDPGAGPCCLLAARQRAEAADLVVVNHALLLSDLERGGGLLPEHDYLIVDEAHHLEAEATRQFGFQLSSEGLEEALSALVGPRSLGAEAVGAYRTAKVSAARRQRTQDAAQALADAVGRARQQMGELFGALGGFLQAQAPAGNGARSQLLITSGTRAQPAWSHLELAGERARSAVAEVARAIEGVHHSLDGLEDAGLLNYRELRTELNSQGDALREVGERLERFFLRHDPDTVFWVDGADGGGPSTGSGQAPSTLRFASGGFRAGLSLHAAPLRVGSLLKERLFDKKQSVVLTSATLSVAGSFGPIRERLGLEDATELLLGSPFDYARAALVCLPRDMPEPDSPSYRGALEEAVVALARAAGGHTMVLFTSHAALRATQGAIRGALDGEEIPVLAQGVDGTPRQLLERFLRDPRAVLLGTASFWEGVDLAGEALQVLVLARLPFDVPTEPVFAARSQLYEEPFREYALPQATLRFRQGFGRLIRTKSDRGVVVVLDRRISSRSYGGFFLRSLPPCAVARPSLAELSATVSRWLSEDPHPLFPPLP